MLLNSPPLAHPFAFLHGFLGSPTDWEKVLSYLPLTSCKKITLPGHQKRPLPATSPLLPPLLDLLLNDLNPLLPQPTSTCILVGYSLGGRLALHFALHYPHLIQKLILIGAHPGLEEGREKRKERDNTWAKHLESKGINSFLTRWYNQPLFHTFSLTPTLRATRSNHHVPDLQRILTELSSASLPPLWEALKRSSLPLLFLHGEYDTPYAKVGSLLKQISTSIQVVSIKGASHALHLENPLATASAIKRFSLLPESTSVVLD